MVELLRSLQQLTAPLRRKRLRGCHLVRGVGTLDGDARARFWRPLETAVTEEDQARGDHGDRDDSQYFLDCVGSDENPVQLEASRHLRRTSKLHRNMPGFKQQERSFTRLHPHPRSGTLRCPDPNREEDRNGSEMVA